MSIYGFECAIRNAEEDRDAIPMGDPRYQAACDRVTNLKIEFEEWLGRMGAYQEFNPYSIDNSENIWKFP